MMDGVTDICFEDPENCPDAISECFTRISSPCNGTTWSSRYDNASAAWVVQCAILMFFMKAGFLFLEISFTKSTEYSDDGNYRRRVVLVKYVDIFAGTFGFWLFGYALSGNTEKLVLGEEQDYIFWFFRFTFATNTATILGGTLVGQKIQLHVVSVFLYSFLMTALIHPFLARIFWSVSAGDSPAITWSPYAYCNGTFITSRDHSFLRQTNQLDGFIFIDFAGSGLVHLCGGTGALVLALFHRMEKWRRGYLKRDKSKKTLHSPRGSLAAATIISHPRASEEISLRETRLDGNPEETTEEEAGRRDADDRSEHGETRSIQASVHDQEDMVIEGGHVPADGRRRDDVNEDKERPTTDNDRDDVDDDDDVPAATDAAADDTQEGGEQEPLFTRRPPKIDTNQVVTGATSGRNFLDWMYPESGGEEHVEYGALGIIILWTTWFAFNAGSTESISGKAIHAAVGRIALVMSLACASAGVIQIIVSGIVKFFKKHKNLNINEIANAILAGLVAVTGCCPFIEPYFAVLIGAITVGVYHFGCYIVYLLRLYDGARVFPVHAMCGFWGVLCVGIFSRGCLIREVYNFCFCAQSTLPAKIDNPGFELFAYQLAGAVFIIFWSFVLSTILFLLLWIIPLFTIFVPSTKRRCVAVLKHLNFMFSYIKDTDEQMGI